MKQIKLQLLFLAGAISCNLSLQAILKEVAETVEKTTAGTAEAVEDVTKTIAPPAEKIVDVPLETAKKTTTAIADVFRDTPVYIINDADQDLTVEVMKKNKNVSKIISIAPGDKATIEKPYAVRFLYGETSTELLFTKKQPKDKPITINVSLEKNNISIKQQKKSHK